MDKESDGSTLSIDRHIDCRNDLAGVARLCKGLKRYPFYLMIQLSKTWSSSYRCPVLVEGVLDLQRICFVRQILGVFVDDSSHASCILQALRKLEGFVLFL